MFDDFRKQNEDSTFPDDAINDEVSFGIGDQDRQFLGMTPVQRFIVAVMLLLMTIILGVLFLLVTSKIAPPFF